MFANQIYDWIQVPHQKAAGCISVSLSCQSFPAAHCPNSSNLLPDLSAKSFQATMSSPSSFLSVLDGPPYPPPSPRCQHDSVTARGNDFGRALREAIQT